MTAITRNLPPFVKDLGIAIVGNHCYASLVENLDISDTLCLKHALSKGLGVGIVAGGSIMKVPQILIILKSGSAEGLSLPAYALETLSYAVTLAYSVQNKFPFTTYGENLFLTAQNVLIILLIVHFGSGAPNKKNSTQKELHTGKLLATLILVACTAVGLSAVSTSFLGLLMYTTLPLSLASKIPQIAQNKAVKSTGNLSVVAVLAQVLGCVARLFTTLQETGDVLVGAGFLMALILNVVLGVQVLAYWPTNVPVKAEEKKAERVLAPEPEKVSLASPVPTLAGRIATPPPQSPARMGSPAGARKWARKVD